MRRGTAFVIIVTVLLLGALLAAPAAAGPAGTDRPFKAHLSGIVTFEFGNPDCAPGPLLTRTTVSGTATHMGWSDGVFTHCPQEVGFVNGRFVLEAANGDELHFVYDNLEDDNPFDMMVSGGTGRFEGASGHVDLAYALDPAFIPGCEIDPENPFPCFDFFAPWGWNASLGGHISY
jgi:hypothetical protein